MNDILGDKKAVAVLIGPALLVYSLVILVPVVWSLGYTLFDGNAISGFTFAGTANLERLATDPQVREALRFTVKFAVVMTVGQVALGYLLALLYTFVLKNRSTLLRTLVFFPVVLPTVAVALLFQKLFQVAPQNGPINAVIEALGGQSIDWLGGSTTAFVVLVLMGFWQSMGFYAILLYTGLLDIPDEVIEAARIDGANGFTLVTRIILPLSLPVLLSSLIFSINGTLKVFDAVVALTGGGPGTSTTPLTVYMFDTAFSYGDYGFGSSIALLLSVICLFVTVAIFRSARRDVTEA